MKKKSLILFSFIFLLGFILRFYNLGSVPLSPDWDEAALGYNAYSIMHTGRDEYGQFLPIVMRSFDDYKPALYSYLTILSIAILGLNVLAVRAPSAIFGMLTIIAVYFLLSEIFESKYKFSFSKFDIDIPLLGSFLLAISPWHIQFSRIAFESNVGLSLNVFSALFFIKGLKKPWLFSLSAFFAAMSIYVYQSEKVFTPLFIFALVLIYRKEIFSRPKKYLISAVLIGIILILPMLFYTVTNKNALQRAQGVSIFAQRNDQFEANTKRLINDKNNNDILGLVLNNRRVFFTKEVISGYLSHYDLNWLFINGDIARHHAPNMGLLYLFELPFLFLGIYSLFFGPFKKQTKLFIFAWFLLVPIPASVTSGVPHAVRTLNFLPTFQIFTSIGLILSLNFLFKVRLGKVLSGFLLMFIIFNFIYYLDQYFIQQDYFNASEWQYGYAKVIPQIEKIQNQYQKIVVSNQAPMDQSYMFFLFYLNYPPKLYQEFSSSGGFREVHSFGKFEFRPINWREDKNLANTLFIGRESDFMGNFNQIFNVNYPNGRSAMKVVKN